MLLKKTETKRNNLRFDGITEEESESWDRSEEKIREILKKDLEINETDIEIERAHRSGKKYRDDNSKIEKRTIVVKFLKYKDKKLILDKFIAKKLWEKQIYINEDFSERTRQQRKDLFQKAKEMRKRGIKVKIVYNKLVFSNVTPNA